MSSPASDLQNLAQQIDLDLLRGIALGGKRSHELQFLLASQVGAQTADFQALALAVANLSVPHDEARRSFEAVQAHQGQLVQSLGRPVGLKAAALDLVEQLEQALKVQEDPSQPSYWQLEQMAFRDQLTGVHNFRYFSSRLPEELQRARRYRHQLSLIMLDIDHFKKFNDTYGHQSGNLALQHLVRILQDTVRETDIVARYGGEEFALILPETTKRLAAELANRVRANVEANPVALAGSQHRITVSLGLATFPRDVNNWQALVECADKALYQSKQGGRNRVTIYAPPSTVVFRYRPPAGESVERCAVVGDFNGWDVRADPMAPQEDGSFWAKVGLIPGTYEYKFVLNQDRWINDPTAGESISDGYWGQNSILHVKA
jgi:diguanylate cyclase (GGDEF)-like protein